MRTHDGPHDGTHDDFGCRVKTITVAPSALATRTRSSVPPRSASESNSWERGIVRDERGMPMLDRNLEPLGMKEWADNPSYAQELKRLRGATTPLPSPTSPEGNA